MNTNQNETTLSTQTQLVLTVGLFILLSSCGTSKSTEIQNSANNFSSTTYKPLANCNKAVTSDLSLSTAAVQNQAGQVDYNWLKLKFNSLSTKSTVKGNVVKFFKWKSINGQNSLDQTALTIFNLSTGATSNQIDASTVTVATNYAVQLNDAQASYQVLKAVVYSADGKIVTQADALIPQFNAKSSDYVFNSDGSMRASNLQSLHPLALTNTNGWSDDQYSQYFQALCF